ncbi:KUP system potassium uptake protein [Chitinophaga costaii]|uniref:Probable potassium transport system protein Kup n=1 Tax=Chitinophaga costaii TaxID=1335309 RepID=A0A1C4BTC3_9BACT|nr:KUP/HAK/KT family potassium transporter [Chitinophaga costaii]PUZ27479.1 potassium transporter Kup [Chitinophaga costaii]SCC10146.1 KUP system potassium uptake protein [Chitinophaga costaii]
MVKNLNKVTIAGLIIALGIIYGDIGTSPLYVFKAIIGNNPVSDLLVIGGVSCIFWTLTLQTTIKYVILTLKADNKGEGGIFSLYALVRRHAKWTVIFCMIGGAALLADGIITPPITVTSAIEGLRTLQVFMDLSQMTIVKIVLAIIVILFVMQQFGTKSIGKLFGPIMIIWFAMLGVLGLSHVTDDWSILKAFSPHYAIELLTTYPKGFLILGAVFLCTTGAEALYSDLGHCGRGNIRVSWAFVKTCLLLNYLGQGAWLLTQRGKILPKDMNPFFQIMPDWFVIYGVLIATMASVIASQALISGSFTLISEAMRLNLWPKLKINYPTEMRGQLYIPGINMMLFVGCVAIVLIFRESSHMEAAYGLSITICMLMTSCLFAFYMYTRRVRLIWIWLYLVVYFVVEFSFLFANLVKFMHGGYVTVVVAGVLFLVMMVWYRSRKIKNRYVEFVKLEDYLPILQELSNDTTIPKYATHLVYMSSADNPKEIEHKVIYSILNKKPKRADLYWFVHVDVVDEPYLCEYSVQTIIPNEVIRVEFRLGFRVEQRINLMFRMVVEDMVRNKEVNITSRYESLSKNNVMGDFQFIVMEKFLSHDNDLPLYERLIMRAYFFLKKISLSEERGFGLDSSYVTIEKYPLVVAPVTNVQLKRVRNNL